MIKIYGKDNCSRCHALKENLENKKVEFEYIEDIKTLMMVASKARIMSAPVVEFDGNYYTMEKFLEVYNEKGN